MRKNHQQHFARRSTQGFSMVELLVVLGVVGLATAVILPAVQTVRRTASSTLCADNLRTLGLAMSGYVNDHQFYPYGYYVSAATGPIPPDGGDQDQYNYVWWTVLRGYISGGGVVQSNANGRDDTIPFDRLEAVFNCPAAVDRTGGVDYVSNAAVMVQLSLERGLSGHPLNRTRNSLARATGVYPDTALLWDAPEVTTGPSPVTRKTQYVISFTIDAAPGTEKFAGTTGLLANPRKPSWRYRNVNNANRTTDPKNYAEHAPIYPGINEDLTNANGSQTAGGIRFRHGWNDEANFLFADGSVRAHAMTRNWDTTPTGSLLRKYFRSKLPPGFSSADAP